MKSLDAIETDDDLVEVLGEATYLSQYQRKGVVISLFHIDNRYIETHYNSMLGMFVAVFFKDQDQLTNNLDAFPITNLFDL